MGYLSIVCPKGNRCLRTSIVVSFALLIAVIWPKPARALGDTESITMPLPTSNEPMPSSSGANYLSVEIQQYNYNSNTAQTTDQFSQYTQLSPQFGYYHKTETSSGFENTLKTDGLLVLPMSAGTHFEVAVPNAFWKVKIPSRHFQLSIGREVQNWSELDEFWHLGIWQPLARWDAADPMTQGLTGVFARISEDRFHMVFFASDIFLPDQQPDYQVSNGQITSDNRWFRAPVSQFSNYNEPSNIDYTIASVNPSSVIFHKSFAVMTEFGQKNAGPYLRTSYAYKPMNQFHIADNLNFNVAENLATVTVLPMVIDEHVFTAETGFHFNDNGEFMLSDTWEHFNNPSLPSNYEQSQLVDSQYLGALYRRDLDIFGLEHAGLGLSYVQRIEQTNPKTDTIIQGEVESSADRMSFDRLAGLQFHAQFWREADSGLDGELGYIYSLSDAGQWVHFLLNYQYDWHWTWSLAGDVLGLPPSNFSSTSFISKYRGNSRVIGGLTYVF